MSFFSKIGRLFKKLWDAIRKILAIILIIIAVILIVWAAVFSGGAALVLFGFAISQTAAFVLGALALTGAFLIDAETSKEVVGKIGDAMGDAAGAVGGAVGNVVGSGIGGLLGSSGGMLLLLGVGAYFLLSSGSKDKKSPAPKQVTNAKPSTAISPPVKERSSGRPGNSKSSSIEVNAYGSIALPA